MPKSLSRDCYGTSNNTQKRGIQVTKSLFKKVSGRRNDKDFSRNCQKSPNNKLCEFQNKIKNIQQKLNDKTGNITGTLDSQRTLQQYQLSKGHKYSNTTKHENQIPSSNNLQNYQNTSTEINKKPSQQITNHYHCYSNEQIPEYNSRNQSQRTTNSSISNVIVKGKHNSVSLTAVKYSTPIKFNGTQLQSRQYGESLPIQYQQRPGCHLARATAQIDRKKITSNSKGTKILSKKGNSKILASSITEQSIIFNKSRQISNTFSNVTIKNPLFSTAHQILSQEVSSLTNPYYNNQKNISGQQLTNLIYGNREHQHNFNKNSLENMAGQEKQKFIVRYKNKTFDDLSVKQSLVQGYEDYYQ